MRFASIEALEGHRAELVAAREGIGRRILVCAGTGCVAAGSMEVYDELVKTVRERDLPFVMELTDCLGEGGCHVDDQGTKPDMVFKSGCHGFCEKGPLVHVMPDDILYTGVQAKDVAAIVEETLERGEVIKRRLYKDPVTKKRIQAREDIPFYAKQTRVALARCGVVDPESLDDYIADGGFKALAKVLSSMTPDQVIDEVAASGLRGRGGGGFSTGRKWRSARKAEGDRKFVICNGDEGDPGAFMDRSIMEGDPFEVIEGMIIGAYAIGDCSEGYIYVRNEYPLAVERLQKAIDRCRDAGLLGEDILGSGFGFDIHISRGGGAFVCGESSALMRSIEGKVGEPRAKYIHATDRGLYDLPTVLNNVETWVCVPPIVEKGAAWFAGMGTDGSKGTKVFSLVGKVRNTGLVEVPMGTTIREIVYGPGGGIINDKPFKAVQTGGPSGGCLPESKLDLPIDFDELTKAGSMMGSGGLIVMDNRTCMVDLARYFVHFLLEESCGKCVPCREGLRQLHFLLEDICHGRGTMEHLDLIEELSEGIKLGSLCALGQTAPNPVLSTLKYFRDEYEAHIRDHYCPAGVCRELTTYCVIEDACTGCQLCAKACPTKAITGGPKQVHHIDQAACIQCGACYDVCRYDAIDIKPRGAKC